MVASEQRLAAMAASLAEMVASSAVAPSGGGSERAEGERSQLFGSGVGRGKGWMFDGRFLRSPAAVVGETVEAASDLKEKVTLSVPVEKLAMVKNMTVKDKISDLMGLIGSPDLPGTVVSSAQTKVGFCGAGVMDLGGWSTATEPP